jgi:hypothetical protein
MNNINWAAVQAALLTGILIVLVLIADHQNAF